MILGKSIKILLLLVLILIVIVYYRHITSKIQGHITIVATARNIESYLENTRKKLEMVSSQFTSSNIIIYENDSTDKTRDILQQWHNEGFIRLISERNIDLKTPREKNAPSGITMTHPLKRHIRTKILAMGRNKLHREAMKNRFDYLMVIDLDNVIEGLTKESLLSCFRLKEDWGMVGANQTGNYYDLWALRTNKDDDWLPFDCWECMDKEYPNHIRQPFRDASKCLKTRHIPASSRPINVQSCFGGTAIYKRKYLDLKNCYYDGRNTCEHVSFNLGVIRNGGKVYINPSFINH